MCTIQINHRRIENRIVGIDRPVGNVAGTRLKRPRARPYRVIHDRIGVRKQPCVINVEGEETPRAVGWVCRWGRVVREERGEERLDVVGNEKDGFREGFAPVLDGNRQRWRGWRVQLGLRRTR